MKPWRITGLSYTEPMGPCPICGLQSLAVNISKAPGENSLMQFAYYHGPDVVPCVLNLNPSEWKTIRALIYKIADE